MVLINQLEVSRDSLRTTLTALADLGLVRKNPGYGHPLRPEYVLTESGKSLAVECSALLAATNSRTVLSRKWGSPVIYSLATGCDRFNMIRELLGITPRALTQTLRKLVEEELVDRTVADDYPPTTTYRLTPSGKKIARRLGRIAGHMG